MASRVRSGRRGNLYDNAKAESFMETIKVEKIYLMAYETFRGRRGLVADFIEHVKQQRLISALGIGAPQRSEQEHARQTVTSAACPVARGYALHGGANGHRQPLRRLLSSSMRCENVRVRPEQETHEGSRQRRPLNPLVGPQQDRLRDIDAERLRRLDVDHELIPCRLLIGRFSTLRPFQDAVTSRMRIGYTLFTVSARTRPAAVSRSSPPPSPPQNRHPPLPSQGLPQSVPSRCRSYAVTFEQALAPNTSLAHV